MASYDFRSLSPADFEELVRDLLQEELGVRLESFSSGRDRGIDLRYAPSADRTLVVQCKHWSGSGFAALKRELRNEEVAKVRRLAPARYVLATSVGLTPDRKDELLEILAPFCTKPDDLIGLKDMNNLLGRHPGIETRHHKLWLTSQAVLKRVLHNATFLQADLERESIQARLALYVQTSAFERARRILDEYNYCIISGIPGIGKTTLAEILVIHLLEKGFDLVKATTSISEALELFGGESEQAIYYDDFLGRSSFGEKLEKNEDQTLIRLLRAVRRSRGKKLILTTREYILSQAKQRYEILNDPELELGRCVVELEDYTRYDRARILYNHLFFHGVPDSHVAALLQGRRYRGIVDHRNFSPRIVESMTLAVRFEDCSSETYAEEFLANLENPGRLWKHAFDHQLSGDARSILLALASLPDTCPVSCLKEASSMPDEGLPGERDRRFWRGLKEIDGTFVRSLRSREELFVEFHSPSVADFLGRELARSRELCEELLERARYFEQVERLVRLTDEGKVEREATGFVSNAALLARVVGRVLESASASVSYISSGSDRWLVRGAEPVGLRLDRVSEWASSLGSVELHEMVLERARALCDEAAAGQSAASLSGIVKAADRSGGALKRDISDLVERIVQAAARELDEMAGTDDWLAWSEAIVEVRHRFTDEQIESFQGTAEAFCEGEGDVIMSNASNADEAASWVEDLAAVARGWGIPFEYELGRLQERIGEYFPEEPDGDYDVGDWPGSQGDSAEKSIDDLFDSLRK